MLIKQRKLNEDVYSSCIDSGYPEVVARIIAGRKDTFDRNIFEFTLDAIQPAMSMAGVPEAVDRISKAISNDETILIFTDYDVDGCTSMAVLYRTLHEVCNVPESRLMRLTGHRTEDGYGLTDTIADKIIQLNPDLVITADAGVSDGERVKKLADAGIDVIISDHHLIPSEGVPEDAVAVVNPHQDSCSYDTKVAGCGVAWLLMTALTQKLECSQEQKIILHQMLDYVALGTVADMVSLDSVTNRYFVKKGLEFMNRKNRICWQRSLNKKPAGVGDLGFQLGPRINASSRMSGRADTAIDFLLSEDPDHVFDSYDLLDKHNKSRQSIESKMLNDAKRNIVEGEPAVVYYSEDNHAGIQGVVAGKIADEFGVPTIMLADVEGGMVAGSGRAGQFLHIRDALQSFDEKIPGALKSFGGHKAAAGLKLHKDDIEIFRMGFLEVVQEQLDDRDITPFKKTDGSLNGFINLDTYYQIEKLKPFGMGFPTPLFFDEMVATQIRIIGEQKIHLSMMLDRYRAVFFGALETPESPWPVEESEKVGVLYSLNLNEWQGQKNLQLMVKRIVGLN